MGKITFAADSLHNLNHGIVDLELAPRDNDGPVQFTADISILAPVELTLTLQKIDINTLHIINRRS